MTTRALSFRPGLRARLAFWLTLILGGLIASGAYLSWRVIADDLYRSLGEQHTALAKRVALELDGKIQVARAALEGVAQLIPDELAEHPDALQRAMQDQPVFGTLFDGAMALGADGSVLAKVPDPSMRGQSVAGTPFFARLLHARLPYVSRPLRGPASGMPLVDVVVPKFSRGGRLTLAYAGVLSLLNPNFVGSMRNLPIGNSGYFVIADSERSIISHRDSGRILQRAGADPLVDRMLAGAERAEELTLDDGSRAWVSYARLRETDWTVAAVYPVAEAFAPVSDARGTLVTLTLAALLLCPLMAWLVAGPFTNRLDALAAQVRAARDAPGTRLKFRRTDADEITELATAFNALLERVEERERQNRLLALAVDHSREAVVLTDTAGFVQRWNRGAEEMFGWGASEAIGRHVRELHRPGITEPELEVLLGRARDRETVRYEARRAHKSGRMIEVAAAISGVYGDDGLLVGLLGSYRDISEEKRAGEALRESEERFARAFHASPASIALFHREDGRIVLINEGFEKLYGHTREQVLGKTFAELGNWDMDERARAMAQLDAEGSVRDFDGVARGAGGDLRDVQFAFEPVSIGGVAHVMGLAIDITERKRSRETLERSVNERTADLQRANQELESFSYTVSHDLRAPLRAIHGFAQLIEIDHVAILPGPARQLLHRVQENAHRMDRLINDLLEFSRVGRKALVKEHIDTRGLVRLVLEELSDGEDAAKAEIVLNALPDSWGDRALLKIVWSNLLSNALKFSRKVARPRVEIGGVQRGARIEFRVSDNGAGFDMQYLHKLFGVFQRLHGEAEFEGTGAGLSIVQRIVERHGGSVSAEGAPGRGATFRFSIPSP